MKYNTITEIADGLIEFWEKNGCEKLYSYDCPMSAGTFHPECFFGSFFDKKAIVYIQPCRRKADGRYGKSPNRFFIHHQIQVFINPIPPNIRDLYFQSLQYIGLDTSFQDFKFIENNWENTSLGAIGVGWEVWCNAMEITQWTYFQTIGDIQLKKSTPVELAYGLERICLHVLNKESILDCHWNKNSTYQQKFQQREYEFSQYIFHVDSTKSDQFYQLYNQAQLAINAKLYIPTYELLLQMNDIFNSLDAQNKIDYLERKTYMDKMRYIANECCKIFIENNNIKI